MTNQQRGSCQDETQNHPITSKSLAHYSAHLTGFMFEEDWKRMELTEPERQELYR